MPTLRSVFVVVTISAFSLPLAACSEGDANELIRLLRASLLNLERQQRQDFLNDPFNSAYDKATAEFGASWPSDLPTPGTGQPEFWQDDLEGADGAQQVAQWKGTDSAEAYDERLQSEGWTRESRTTATDPATGREETTSTYRNEIGRRVEVWTIQSGTETYGPGTYVWVFP